jgi:predicted metal-dependent hydrolase
MSTDRNTNANTHLFQYGHSVVEYKLQLAERNSLAITVRPDKSVIVRAPTGSSLQAIQSKLQKRGRWVIKQINYFDKFHPIQPSRQYVGGETHCYLGRKYRLRIQKGGGEQVKLSGKFFWVNTKVPKNRNQVKLLMLEWYALHAKAFFDQRILKYSDQLLEGRKKTINIEYGVMKTRWGSCLGDSTVKINIELIKTPLPCIDYVIVHELCHLVRANHDKQFYKLLEKAMPDWQERKQRLEVFNAL